MVNTDNTSLHPNVNITTHDDMTKKIKYFMNRFSRISEQDENSR